jgi:hypothetical protein
MAKEGGLHSHPYGEAAPLAKEDAYMAKKSVWPSFWPSPTDGGSLWPKRVKRAAIGRERMAKGGKPLPFAPMAILWPKERAYMGKRKVGTPSVPMAIPTDRDGWPTGGAYMAKRGLANPHPTHWPPTPPLRRLTPYTDWGASRLPLCFPTYPTHPTGFKSGEATNSLSNSDLRGGLPHTPHFCLI